MGKVMSRRMETRAGSVGICTGWMGTSPGRVRGTSGGKGEGKVEVINHLGMWASAKTIASSWTQDTTNEFSFWGDKLGSTPLGGDIR